MADDGLDEMGYPKKVEVFCIDPRQARSAQRKQATWDTAKALQSQRPGYSELRFSVCWEHVCGSLKGDYERKLIDKLLEARIEQILKESADLEKKEREAATAEEEKKKREAATAEEEKKKREAAIADKEKKRPPPPADLEGQAAEPPAKKPASACVVCSERSSSQLIRPCKHVCLCEVCAKSPGLNICPICRCIIVGFEKVFVA
jgi:hypothetical protein